MDKIKLIKETDELLKSIRKEFVSIREAEGFEGIFNDISKELKDVSMLPNNVIDISKYKEQEIIQTLKKLGYEYKKPFGNKLHFFNKKTSISVYLEKNKGKITPIP
jgi:signal recognition particle subunit SEC65